MDRAYRMELPAAGRTVDSSKRTGFSLFAYCVALPLFGRAVFPIARDKAHITLLSSFADPQMLATYFLASVVVLRLLGGGRLLDIKNRDQVIRWLAFFVLACLVSSFNSRLPLFSVWRSFEVAVLTAWAFVMIRDAKGTADPARAVRAFYGISIAILIGVFIGLIINPSGAWSMEGDVARLTGSTGYSINPNDIGAIAAVVAVGSYVRAIERRSFKHAVAAIVFFAVCYLSYSRGSYIALTAGLAAATLMLGRRAGTKAIVYATACGAAIILISLILISPELRNFFVFMMTRGHETENLESFGGRLQLWEFGLQIFTRHLFLGTGYGTYPEGLEGGHFHNMFIELLVTTGIVGTLCFAVFVFHLIRLARKSVGRSNRASTVDRIIASDLVTIPTVIIVANGATAGAAYYSWDLLGLVSVAVTSSLLLAKQRHGSLAPVTASAPASTRRFSNLLP